MSAGKVEGTSYRTEVRITFQFTVILRILIRFGKAVAGFEFGICLR
jgi:hypothetical protein